MVKTHSAGAAIPAGSRLRQSGLHAAEKNFRHGPLPPGVLRDPTRARVRGGVPGAMPPDIEKSCHTIQCGENLVYSFVRFA